MIQRRDLLAGLLGTGMASRAAAQATSRTARMLVGFPPGGSIDLVARALVEHVKVPSAAATIVDSRPGAGGRLALEALKAAPPDGLTVGLTPGDQLTLFPSIYRHLSYDPLRDFAPISTVCTFPFALAIGPLVPMEVVTVADFMAWCRANPKQANFGSPGEGTRPHFMGAALARAAGVELTHLPYKGGPAALQDLLAGQVAAMVSVLSNVLPHARSGRLRDFGRIGASTQPALARDTHRTRSRLRGVRKGKSGSVCWRRPRHQLRRSTPGTQPSVMLLRWKV